MLNNPTLEIAKLIGQPIDTQLPVPYELAKICDYSTEEAGDHAYRYSALDTDADVILQADTTNGVMLVKKRSPLGDTLLEFTALDSQLEYVLVNDIINSPDTKKLARRKDSITRGMDKVELKTIIELIEADNTTLKPGEDVYEDDPEASGEDLYDAIMSMVHTVEDYGDNFVLLCGSAVKIAIDNFDKDQAATLNYRMSIRQMLKDAGIEIIKMFGQVSTVTAETPAAIMNTNHAILVAKNSRIASGAPIKFVRRKINAEIASLMGADVTNAERAIVVQPTPVQVGSNNTLAYGVYGFESVCYFISNPRAIVKADFSSLVA